MTIYDHPAKAARQDKVTNTRDTKNEEFPTEAGFVEKFVGMLHTGRTPFGAAQVTTEWDHRSGFVDVLARDRSQMLVAFEAKLSDWKRAFHQAYRNTAYANRTYVLLPQQVAHRALRDKEEFEFRGIGLCSFDGQKVQVHIEATEQDPLLRWLHDRAHKHFDTLPDDRPTRSSGRRRTTLPATRV